MVLGVPEPVPVPVWVCDIDGVLDEDKEVEGVPDGVFEGEGVLRSRLAWKRTLAIRSKQTTLLRAAIILNAITTR